MDVEDWLAIYKNSGIAVIPCKAGKKEPAIQWGKYQKTPPTSEQINEWFKKNRCMNFAAICGEASQNLVVLDFDYPEVFKKFFDQKKVKDTWVVQTPHGFHVYFRSYTPVKSFVIRKCVEVRSTGNYVIAPPSFFVDHEGKELSYKFLSRPEKIQMVSNLEEAVVRRAIELGHHTEEHFDSSKWLNLTFGYKGETPPCITKLVRQSAPVGERDERALRIASYYANFCNDINTAREKLLRWYENIEKTGKDPFTLQDTIRKVDSARNGKYVYGCDDWLLQKFCSPCPLGESKFVNSILESPSILQHIKKLLDDVIAGEDANKQLVFLLLLSGKVSNPQRKQIVLLQGEAGGGKTTLANNISSLFKTKKIGRFTKHALDYSDLEEYDVLYLQEIGTMDKEDQGVSTLKFLSSDDKGYTVEVTVRDPETKEWVTSERRIPPITVITTTTRVDIDPQFSRRAWLLNVDESITQTKNVRTFKVNSAIERSLVSLGFQKESKRKRALRILNKLVAKLSDCDIVILFPESIIRLLGEPRKLRVRGDYDKFLELAWLTGILYQNQGTLLPSNPGKKPVYLPPCSCIAEMFKITKKPLVAMTTNLEERFLSLFEAIEQEGFRADSMLTHEERAKLAERLGKQPSTIDGYFRALHKKCSFILRVKDGRQVNYKMTKNLAEIESEILSNSYIAESTVSLALKFLNESKKWVNTILESHPTRGISSEFYSVALKSIEKEEKQLKNQDNPANTFDSKSKELNGSLFDKEVFH